jgi:NAD(P)-dependent dehydrogenase (short-subunit alcohol dehydrogenase family)
LISSSVQGVGFHTAYQLAAKGAKVYVGARSAFKAEAAIQEMRQESPSIGADKLLPFVVDLGDIRAVKAAAQHILSTESRLDILINNAALYITYAMLAV